MKIVKAPEFEVITCGCGVVFQPEYDDNFEFRLQAFYPHDRVVCIKCPYCGDYHEVTRVPLVEEG
jgi:hypothetical protein